MSYRQLLGVSRNYHGVTHDLNKELDFPTGKDGYYQAQIVQQSSRAIGRLTASIARHLFPVINERMDYCDINNMNFGEAE